MGWGGGWSKDCAFILPNPKWEWAAGIGGRRKEGEADWNTPTGFLWVAGHRWLPSRFQLGTSGSFLLPCGSSCLNDLGLLVRVGQGLEETPPNPIPDPWCVVQAFPDPLLGAGSCEGWSGEENPPLPSRISVL